MAAVGCGGGPTPEPYTLFQERLAAGASCQELFEIRDTLDPYSERVAVMGSELGRIGCVSNASLRNDRPTPALPATSSPITSRDVATTLPQIHRWSEQQYIAWITLPFVSEALSDIGTLFNSPIPSSASWRDEVGLKAFVIMTARDEAQGVQPPLRFEKVHATYLEALEAYADAARLMQDWLESVETDPGYVASESSIRQLELMTANMESGTALMQLATVQIE